MITTQDRLPARASGRRAFVPTMGALHAGHVELIRHARELVGPDGELIVSVFVNPTQFSAGEDFDRYPRDLGRDERVCADHGVDVLYAPNVATVYGPDEASRIVIDPGWLGSQWEGASRPGHFSGVLTVVGILLHHVAPDTAVFGEKDYQQLQLISRMCRQLSFPVQVIGVETVRESDGLAMSSRNAYLTPDQRRRASAIPRALEQGRAVQDKGADVVCRAVRAVLDAAEIHVDYVDVCAPDLSESPESGEARLIVAVTIGDTRLIDNCSVVLGTLGESCG